MAGVLLTSVSFCREAYHSAVHTLFCGSDLWAPILSPNTHNTTESIIIITTFVAFRMDSEVTKPHGLGNRKCEW